MLNILCDKLEFSQFLFTFDKFIIRSKALKLIEKNNRKKIICQKQTCGKYPDSECKKKVQRSTKSNYVCHEEKASPIKESDKFAARFLPRTMSETR